MKNKDLSKLVPHIATIGAMADVDPIGIFRREFNQRLKFDDDNNSFFNTEEKISKCVEEMSLLSPVGGHEFHIRMADEYAEFKVALDNHLAEFMDKKSDTYLEIIDKVESAIIRHRRKAEEILSTDEETSEKLNVLQKRHQVLTKALAVRNYARMALACTGDLDAGKWRNLKHSLNELVKESNMVNDVVLLGLVKKVIKLKYK